MGKTVQEIIDELGERLYLSGRELGELAAAGAIPDPDNAAQVADIAEFLKAIDLEAVIERLRRAHRDAASLPSGSARNQE